MNDKEIILAANIIFNHRLNKKTIKNLPQKLTPTSIKESYQIQNELKILYLTLNNNLTIGKKVGCTNKDGQKLLNISEPFYGNLFSRFADSSGCKLKSNNFYNPLLEPEISFRIKEDININKSPFTIADASFLFDFMLPSIEIVDLRFGTDVEEVGINNLIINNGASEFYIQGSKFFNLEMVDLNNQLVKLFINNKIVEEGNTNLVLENPLNSAIWLINKLSSQGEPMLKGQFITTGTCTKAVKLIKNSVVKADFGSLGCVEFEYI